MPDERKPKKLLDVKLERRRKWYDAVEEDLDKRGYPGLEKEDSRSKGLEINY